MNDLFYMKQEIWSDGEKGTSQISVGYTRGDVSRLVAAAREIAFIHPPGKAKRNLQQALLHFISDKEN